MSRKINKHIAEALEMDVPEEIREDAKMLITIDPHELVALANEDLPDMVDIEHRLLEGEKQLEMVITKTMSIIDDMQDSIIDDEPKYRNRKLEILSLFVGNLSDLVKFKVEAQLKKKKSRMEEAKFAGKGGKAGGGQVHNHYYDRNEILSMMKKADNEAEAEAEVIPEDSSKETGSE